MQGPRLATLAWRNIWRNRRRTLITLLSIAFGVLLATLFTGIGDASYAQMIDQSARLAGGHVVVQNPAQLEVPSLARTIQGADALRDRALADPEVARAVPRIAGPAMLSTSANSTGVAVLGVDPTLEDAETFGLLDALRAGAMFKATDAHGIVLGATLAENLSVDLGKKVVLTVTDKRGEIASSLARVTGIIHTGAPTIDGGICLVPIDGLRALLGYAPGEATQLAVFVDGHRKAPGVAARLAAGAPADVSVLTWDHAQPDLAGFITMKQTSTTILEGIITVLIAAGIFNTLFVSVMERLREFGIMAALGFSRGQLFALVMWESLWLALCGLVAGAAVTAYPYYYLSTTGIDMSKMMPPGTEVVGVAVDPVLHVQIYGPHAALIAAAIVLATMSAGLYPAWKAGRVAPVETIRIV